MMVERQVAPEPTEGALRVLLIDRDDDVSELITAVLTDEGYEVSALNTVDHDSIAATVGRLEPDCILLDGTGAAEFGESWEEAAYLAARSRAVPTIMFTAHANAVREARDGTSDRAQAAGFAEVVPKPFSLDELLEAIAAAAGRSDRFDRSEVGDRGRTRELAEQLSRAGATDIRTSERREWATFVPPRDQRVHQLYWWQRLGLYIVGRYDEEARLERVGQFYEREAAIAASVGPEPGGRS